MGVCKVCGKEIANSLTGICDDCQKMLDTLTDKDVCETVYNETYGCLEDGGYYAVYSAINPNLFNDNSNKKRNRGDMWRYGRNEGTGSW